MRNRAARVATESASARRKWLENCVFEVIEEIDRTPSQSSVLLCWTFGPTVAAIRANAAMGRCRRCSVRALIQVKGRTRPQGETYPQAISGAESWRRGRKT